jgi:hypothetical protein
MPSARLTKATPSSTNDPTLVGLPHTRVGRLSVCPNPHLGHSRIQSPWSTHSPIGSDRTPRQTKRQLHTGHLIHAITTAPPVRAATKPPNHKNGNSAPCGLVPMAKDALKTDNAPSLNKTSPRYSFQFCPLSPVSGCLFDSRGIVPLSYKRHQPGFQHLFLRPNVVGEANAKYDGIASRNHLAFVIIEGTAFVPCVRMPGDAATGMFK